MKILKKSLIFFLLILFVFPVCSAEVPLNTTSQVFFSPKGGCTTAIVNALNAARQEILVQAYSFTSQPIAQALVSAYKRNIRTCLRQNLVVFGFSRDNGTIKVEIILDKSQLSGKGSLLNLVAQAGIPTYIDSAHAIAHNKIMIVDRKTVITGSFNFTESAELRNAENLR